MAADVASQRAFLGSSALLFATGAAVTILRCESMSEMSGMPMPGGWTMSMTWMRMPGQAWSDAAMSFLGMWMVMMATMMLPSLVPMLWRYRLAVASTKHLGRLTMLAGLGYLVVWSVIGMLVFPLGVALATLEMQQPALARVVPAAAGVLVALLGAFQFTPWKARRLASCREDSDCCAPAGARVAAGPTTHAGARVAAGHTTHAGARVAAGPTTHAGAHVTAGPTAAARPIARASAAVQHGLRLGLQCSACCANLMAIPLIIGLMDLRAMAIATAAITVERLAPAGQRVARAVGVVIVGAGLALAVGASTF